LALGLRGTLAELAFRLNPSGDDTVRALAASVGHLADLLGTRIDSLIRRLGEGQ
jgi:hypothetical protein